MHVAEKSNEEEEGQYELRSLPNRGAGDALEPLREVSGLRNVGGAKAAEGGVMMKQENCEDAGRLCKDGGAIEVRDVINAE